jgi:hypothetical protein
MKSLQSAAGMRLVPLPVSEDLVAARGGYPWLRPRSQVMERTPSFGEENFSGIDLGDARRRTRLIRAADDLCRHPGGTLPDKLPQPADLRAFYRLMNCRRVTHEVLMRAHADATRRRIAALDKGVVLVLHDATELDYTSKKSLEFQLGQIGQGTQRGYICHNSLAVHVLADPSDGTWVPQTLGLLSQLLHRRPRVAKRETVKQARERLSRESRLWRRGVEACGPCPTGVRCIDVSDSLSDTFEYMAYEVSHDRHFVLRARENRRLQETLGGQRYLFAALRRLRPQGTRTIQIQNAPGRQARQTTVHVAFAPICLALPGKKSGDYDNEALRLWAVRVWEPNTPANEEPLEWILLTNCPVTGWEEARQCIAWYECRWIVEEYHKGMKTGCGIETLQFEHIQRLEPAIALISAVATTLLRLRDAARAPDAAQRLAVEVVDRVYVEALAHCYPARLKGKPTVLQFYMHVARLGGHQNRKSDGFPGWLTLWRGWTKLEAIVTGFTNRSFICG